MLEYKKGGNLLDIGCSTGDFLQTAQDFFNVEGLELSSWAVNIAERRGFKIHDCSLGELPICRKYDVVTIWGVIEHFEFPASEIKSVYRILNRGGIICLWTGNVESPVAKLLGKKWWYYQGQHIQMFTKKSIRRLFCSSGFRELYLGIYPYVLTKKSFLNSIKRYPLLLRMIGPFVNKRERIEITIKVPGEMFCIFEKP